ncbi:MAG: CdaR family transcriptional regulator [Leucobacter sp.]
MDPDSSPQGSPGAQGRLSTALAQRIVDELTPALEENLNLMDAEGFIIASRDASRVGALHPAAREAAALNRAVVVHADTARPGERPGVNLPLEYRGRVIGVVGVTGPPEKVQALAPVLKLTIAMLFEREAELVGESQRDAADRDLLSRLVYGSRPEVAIKLLTQRAPALPGPWVLALGASAPGGGTGASVVFDARTVARLRRGLSSGGALAVTGALRGVLWVLFDGSDPEVAARIGDIIPGVLLVHSGVCVSGADLIREAGHLAVLSTRTELIAPFTTSVPMRDAKYFRLQLVAAQLPGAVTQSLAAVLDGMTPGELATLRGYLVSGNAAELSRSGFTHRNTVQRRLRSIAERTGYDLRFPSEAAVLALALAAVDERATTVHDEL